MQLDIVFARVEIQLRKRNENTYDQWKCNYNKHRICDRHREVCDLVACKLITICACRLCHPGGPICLGIWLIQN